MISNSTYLELFCSIFLKAVHSFFRLILQNSTTLVSSSNKIVDGVSMRMTIFLLENFDDVFKVCVFHV